MWHNLKFNYLKKKCFPADVLDFSEDGLRVVASGPRRPPQGKPAEKNPDTLRRIFSAQKKVRRDTAAESHEGLQCLCDRLSDLSVLKCHLDALQTCGPGNLVQSQTKTLFCLYLTRKPLGSKILYSGDRSKEAHSYRAAKIWNINIRKHGG